MGEKDIAEKTLESYNDVFADLLNYSLLTLMAFEEGDSHFKENSLMP